MRCLNPKYQCMLAHKVDGKHPIGYSDLHISAQKLERRAEARDPLLLKPTSMGGSNVTHSQTSGSLFPFQKLKGGHTLTARSATVEKYEVMEDSGMKVEETKSSGGKTLKLLMGLKEQISH